MLKELRRSQTPGEPLRRWFVSEDLEVIVWLGADATITGFQLCYKLRQTEHALTWTQGAGFRHDRIDDGEGNPGKNQTPILVADGAFDAEAMQTQFAQSSTAIDPGIRAFVLEKLRELPLGMRE